jgi:ATP adenylyltransferase
MSSDDRTDGPPDVETAAEHAGEADGFERLWTPHRMVYLGGQDRPVDDAAGDGCPFCRIPQLPDEQGLVVARGTHAFVVLNLYPYNSGHLLVCPFRHVADYTDLTADETREVAELTQTAMRVIRTVSAPRGFNVGINQGEVAGAGIAAHLHQHLVPRWGGDSNFLPIVARSRALPELLGRTRAKLAAAWPGGSDEERKTETC